MQASEWNSVSHLFHVQVLRLDVTSARRGPIASASLLTPPQSVLLAHRSAAVPGILRGLRLL